MAGLQRFGAWRRERPFVGALLIAIAGIEMFFSTQLDIGKLHVQLGIEGFQATIIPVGFLLLAVLVTVMPQHRIFYGVIALALSLYSIVGVNLGGFIIGMLLSAVGGILVVSWAPPVAVGAGAGVVESSSEAVGDAASLGDAARAEFAPYSELVAIAGASRTSDAAA
jgi:hypothetical protein